MEPGNWHTNKELFGRKISGGRGDRWMGGQVDGGTGGWGDRWMGGQVDGGTGGWVEIRL